MKRKFVLAVVFLMMIGTFTGCKDAGPSPSEGDNEMISVSSSAETEQEAGQEKAEEAVSSGSETAPAQILDASEAVEDFSEAEVVEDYKVELEEDEVAEFQ